jgi:nitric oxide reductase large subunit
MVVARMCKTDAAVVKQSHEPRARLLHAVAVYSARWSSPITPSRADLTELTVAGAVHWRARLGRPNGTFPMTDEKKLWTLLIALLIVSFGVLLWSGNQIYQKAPPMPERVVSSDGRLIYTRAEIEKGRQVWQSMGGMQLGSIWGHGGYVAPDWSADWLHREIMAMLDRWAQSELGAAGYADLTEEQKSALQGRLRDRVRKNTYDAETGTIRLGADRAAAIALVSRHYQSLFGNDPETADLREAYAMKNGTVPDPENRRVLSAFCDDWVILRPFIKHL